MYTWALNHNSGANINAIELHGALQLVIPGKMSAGNTTVGRRGPRTHVWNTNRLHKGASTNKPCVYVHTHLCKDVHVQQLFAYEHAYIHMHKADIRKQ